MKSTPAPAAITEAIESLQRLTEVFALRRQQLAQAAGLTEAQWRVLEEISTEHFMPSMFARRRDCSAAAVSKILRQLLGQGVIEASIDADDGRQRNYALTAEGKRRVQRLRRERKKAMDEVWADLPPAALERFSAFSDELAGRLEAYAEERA